MTTESKYAAIPISKGEDAMDELIEELGRWPSRGSFVREATLLKVKGEQVWLLEIREKKD